MENLGIIILAAGLGKRMKSVLPKVLQKVCGKTLISYISDLSMSLNPELCCTVLGHKSELVKTELPESFKIALQTEQLGTGHAVLQASDVFRGFDGKVLILCGDVPALTSKTLKKMISFYDKKQADCVILTTEVPDPKGYGRIVRNEDNTVNSIVEEKDANSIIKQIREVNSGIYCFNSRLLFKYLPNLKNENKQSEYYLTDVISMMVNDNRKVFGIKTNDMTEVQGVNDRIQLSEIEKKMYRSIADYHLNKGVVIIEPDNVYIDSNTKIGAETIIYPNSFLINCEIGKNCVINQSEIKNSEIKENTYVLKSIIENSQIGNNVKINNYNVIKSTGVSDDVTIENNNVLINLQINKYSEIKNNCSLENLRVGKSCYFSNNVSVTSFDGIKKHSSIVEDDVYFGSGTQIVSPVKIEEKAYITSGTTVIKNVEKDCLIMNRPQVISKCGYFQKIKKKLNEDGD